LGRWTVIGAPPWLSPERAQPSKALTVPRAALFWDDAHPVSSIEISLEIQGFFPENQS
jgi:hypothetical protein